MRFVDHVAEMMKANEPASDSLKDKAFSFGYDEGIRDMFGLLREYLASNGIDIETLELEGDDQERVGIAF